MVTTGIDKYGEYFHIELLKFYFNYLECYELEPNEPLQYLHFEFEEGTYIIQYTELINLAEQEANKLKNKYN